MFIYTETLEKIKCIEGAPRLRSCQIWELHTIKDVILLVKIARLKYFCVQLWKNIDRGCRVALKSMCGTATVTLFH